MIVETPARLQPVVVPVLWCYIQCHHPVYCTDSVDHRWVLSEYRCLDCYWKWDLQGKETHYSQLFSIINKSLEKIVLNFCTKLINVVLNLRALDIILVVFHKLLATAAGCGCGPSCCCSFSQAFSYCCWWFFFLM